MGGAEAGTLVCGENAPRLMRPFDDPDLRADGLDDTISHVGIMGAGVPDWIASSDTRCEHDCFCSSFDQHLCPRYCPLPGASAACHKPDNVDRPGLLERTFPLFSYEEIRGPRTHILRHHTADNAYFHTNEFSWYPIVLPIVDISDLRRMPHSKGCLCSAGEDL